MKIKVKASTRIALLWLNNDSGIIKTKDGNEYYVLPHYNEGNIKVNDDKQRYITAHKIVKYDDKEVEYKIGDVNILLKDIVEVEHEGVFYELSETLEYGA